MKTKKQLIKSIVSVFALFILLSYTSCTKVETADFHPDQYNIEVKETPVRYIETNISKEKHSVKLIDVVGEPINVKEVENEKSGVDNRDESNFNVNGEVVKNIVCGIKDENNASQNRD